MPRLAPQLRHMRPTAWAEDRHLDQATHWAGQHREHGAVRRMNRLHDSVPPSLLLSLVPVLGDDDKLLPGQRPAGQPVTLHKAIRRAPEEPSTHRAATA